MKGKMNVLISSTRQWNPGDEFIAMGVRNLLKYVLKDQKINWILYDRNPDLFVDGFSKPIYKNKIWSNVFYNHKSNCIDLAVVAGTPEWFGLPMKRFYEAVKENNIPLLLLGVGYINYPINFSDDELYCFRRLLKLAVVRDEYASSALKKVGVSHEILPCPALFAAELKTSQVEKEIGKKIGFIIQTNRTPNQSIPEELMYASVWLVKELRRCGFKVDVICHYIDEFIEFSKILSPVRYSYDSADYISIVAEYDVIISTRLHGAILANCLNKPAILLNKDSRCRGASKLFPFIHIANPSNLIDQINEVFNLPIYDLKKWKEKIKMKYINLLQSALEEDKNEICNQFQNIMG